MSLASTQLKKQTPLAYCQQKAGASGSSFYYSFLFLPPAQKQAVLALYAFCREVDDVVDECRDPGVAAKKLQWWQDELDRLYQGIPSHPVTQALQLVQSTIPLPKQLFQDIIDGMAMDLSTHRYADFSSVAQYCYRAASVVGLLTVEILGYSNEQTLKFAVQLGIALQWINIIRDVGDDARRSRIYLPQDELDQFGVSEKTILNGQMTPAMHQLFAFQAQRARRYYADALALLPECDRHRQSVSLVMANVYMALLDEIERTDFDVMQQRIALTPLRKLWVAWRTMRCEKKRARHYHNHLSSSVIDPHP